jgi:dipeptide/tripeptide permease
VYILGIGILVLSSLSYFKDSRFAVWGLVLSMCVIGAGTGGIKSNVAPLIAEQIPISTPHIITSKDGRRSVVDHEVTMQRVFMVFYMCINIGSIAAVATVLLEANVGFWAAFLLPLLVFIVGYIVLVRGKERYVIKPPQGGVMGKCFRLLYVAARNGMDLENAKGKGNWDDVFVGEVHTALNACRVFAFYPVYWLAFGQMANNFVSQGTYIPSYLRR